MPDSDHNININVRPQLDTSSIGKTRSTFGASILADTLIGPIQEQFNKAVADQIDRFNEILFEIDISKIENFPEEFAEQQKVLNAIVDQRREFFKNNPIEEFKRQLKDVFIDTGIVLSIEDLIAEKPELDILFGPTVRKEIDDAVLNFIENQKGLIDKALETKRNQQEGLDTLAKFFENVTLEELPEKLIELFKNIIKNVPTQTQNLNPEEVVPPDLKNKLEEQTNAIDKQNDQIKIGKKLVNEYSDEFGILEGAVTIAGDGFVAGAGAQEKFLITTQSTAEELEKEVEQVNNLDINTQNLVAQNQNLTNSQNQATAAVKEGGKELVNTAEGAGELAEESEVASNALDSLGVFASNVATEISETFSDFLFEAFKGNFDNIGDLWDDFLDTLLRTFTDFASAIITNPIRVTLEGTLSGKAGGGGIGGLFSGIGDLLGPVGDLFKSGGPLASIGDFFGDLFAEGGPLGFLGQIGNFLGPIGSAVSAVASIAIPLIGGLLKKTPRLDLDFDTFRDEAGKSLGIAAEVADFLDSEVFNNEIFNRSVSRQAGLGLGSELPNVIREAIEGQINALQDIINQLPFEVAAQLNESLLNTAVDIESEVKGDRLLEFDETKNIQEKFQKFINGDLQARFLFSIRDFFVGAFESLGVLGSAAQNFIDAEFEAFQGLNREQRAEAGKELVEDFQTLVDAFNVINNNGPDSIGATVNSIKNLSNSLGFDAVPSIEELDSGLEDLINAAELDPDIIQDYLDLRNAILEAQRAILGSIQSIISSISSLNSIITGAGGSAFDLGGFINDGINSLIGLLGQDGLSIEDQEELLGLGTGFLDQLIAEEQAAFQAQLEAAQQAAEAVAEAQRQAIRAQIDGLEEEKRLIEENFDARIDALQEELRIAEEFARLTESIKQTLDSIILGPDSVFTAVERLNIVQGNIANIQSELAATTDPSRQLELAAQLEDSLSTLFDLAGEAFGVNSPEFTAIFEQVTGGLNDLLDLTGNRTRSVEEINAEIEALNIERNQQLEAIDAQIANLNDQLSAVQAANVDATFQVSDQVLEYAEFFRGEYVRLLEERFAQLAEVSDTGFATEIEALNALTEGQFQQLELEAGMLIELRTISSALQGAASFRTGTNGFVDFGSGTLAFLHGREAVIPESRLLPLGQFQEAAGDLNVNINVNVDGGSAGTVDSLAMNIEDMLVRSIRQGGKLRSAVQEAGAKRLN